MNRTKQTVRIGILSSLLLSLVACGGGGDTNTVADTGLTYNGNNSEAVITSNSLTSFNVNTITISNLANSIYADFTSVLNTSADPATNLCTDPKALTAIVASDVGTGKITGLLEFNNCTTLTGNFYNGRITATGQQNLATKAIDSLALTFDKLQFKDSLDINNIIIDGTVTAVNTIYIDLTVVKLTANFIIDDVKNNKTLKIENFISETSQSVTAQSVTQTSQTMSGKYYDSVLGYVSLETISPVIKLTTDKYPRAGTVRMSGASELNANKATIEITFLTKTTYNLKADFDGDGVLEVDQTCNWSQACVIPTNG